MRVADQVDPDLPQQVGVTRRRGQVANFTRHVPARLGFRQFLVDTAHQFVHLHLAGVQRLDTDAWKGSAGRR